MTAPQKDDSLPQEANSRELLTLVSAAQEGDEEAFGTLYGQFVTPIYRFIFYNVRNRDEAEDLTQTVFLRAFRALPSYKSRGVPFGAWLYAIARNATIDYWKKKRDVLVDNPEELFDTIESGMMSAEEETASSKRNEYLQSLLTTLSEDQREVIVLSFIEERSHEEIAMITGKSEEAVRALKHRALKALRGKIDEKYL